MIAPYNISPGIGVGIFQIGDTLWHILDLLRTHKNDYPKFDVSWDAQRPHTSAVVIHLAQLTLYFPAPSQLLTLISFPSLLLPNLTLIYETQVLASPDQPLTRARVARILGPTFANEGRDLVYPGVKFEMASSSGGSRDDVVEKLDIQVKEGEEVTLAGQLTSCIIQPGKGVTLSLAGDPEPLEIIIGSTTAQDLLLDLGSPLRKFWKEDDRLERMWGREDEVGACFWNYFQYGLDFLISTDNFVSKILCYSNIPGTPMFQQYARCPWVLSTTSGALNLASPSTSFGAASDSDPSQYIDSKEKQEKYQKRGISKKVAGEAITKDSGKVPMMVLDRAVEGGLEGVQNVGESRLIGHKGFIIEEDQVSGGICSVLVWKDTT
ncbi:uncharacterized protein L203_103571 [Cryptococcus depauperatus CBS 7841]|uniref:Uncharacterized protein n=1 Tax=Cryptococcus depauperatus CBS 7841 TaxID=1295531 RepID=A0AAJ8M1D6_9TREE